MPLGSDHKAGKIWDGIIEKTEKKLAIWKSQYLSLGGRVTLINSILDSLPTYVMPFFRTTNRIVEVLDALRRNFLWQGKSVEDHQELWEIDGVVELLSLIGGFPGNTLKTHKLAWGNHKDGVFSVNRLYNWGLRRSAGRSTGPCVTGVGAL
ncbi:hypothetical protein MTR67_043277 [Solanum verrucosum]|uniref:Uncharacterized protein n=1 Tax=Solanum verrucosum TaxID=315347 RepID=A0AAF0ZRX9_SOLVR|nr:hypothetical protein MTR67_043277 [Solanum verrucosum]